MDWEARELDTTARPADDRWVAVLGQWRKGCLRLPLPYVDALEMVGVRSKVLAPFELLPSEKAPEGLEVLTELDPYDPSPLEGASGLLLCGGGDIDPALYGRPRHPRTHNVSQKRDLFESTFLGAALDRDLPVFAICRGMQMLNVHLGGTLNQHLMDDPGKLDHYRDRPLAEPAHNVALTEGSVAAEAMGGTNVSVNTHHHQGLDEVAPQLDQIGWSEDGVLEVVASTEHTFVLGVQWHPEAMVPMHTPQKGLFHAFSEAVSSYGGSARTEGMQARSA